MKVCTKCGEEKNFSEFSRNKRNKDGYNFWCRGCFAWHHKNSKGIALKKRRRVDVLLTIGKKVCTKCKETLDVSLFGVASEKKRSLTSSCKECTNKRNRVSGASKFRNVRMVLLAIGKKTCTKCGSIKDIHMFCKNTFLCKLCSKVRRERNKASMKEYHAIYREKNRAKARAYDKEYNKNNTEKLRVKSKKFRDANKARLSAQKKVYYKDNRSKILSYKKERVTALNPMYDAYAHKLSVDDSPSRSKDDSDILMVKCKMCGKDFTPTVGAVVGRVGSLSGAKHGENSLYCSDGCKSACPVFGHKPFATDPRSKLHIPKTEQEKARSCQTDDLKKLQLDEVGYNYCEKCGKKVDVVHLHHTHPISKYGGKAINSSGHILLCVGCHVELHKECI